MKPILVCVLVLLTACAPRVYRGEYSAPVPAPADQLFTEKYPDFLSWNREHGIALLAAEKGISPTHFNQTIFYCLTEYDYNQMLPEDRAALDLGARHEITLTYAQYKEIGVRTGRLTSEEEAARYCGIESIDKVITAN